MEKQTYIDPETRVIELLPGHRILDTITSKPVGTGDDWVIIED